MNSAEKILQGILDTAKEEAEQITKQSICECEEIASKAKIEAKETAQSIDDDTEKRVAMINSTGESGVALIQRDNTLAAKHERIEAVLKATVEKINAMPDSDYFDFMSTIVAKSGLDKGVISFGAIDKNRDFGIMQAKLNGTNITLDSAPADIANGFVLKDGDIQINGTLDALIHEKHSELVETIYPILF